TTRYPVIGLMAKFFTATPPAVGSGMDPTAPDPTATMRDSANDVIASNCAFDNWFAPSTWSSRMSTYAVGWPTSNLSEPSELVRTWRSPWAWIATFVAIWAPLRNVAMRSPIVSTRPFWAFEASTYGGTATASSTES